MERCSQRTNRISGVTKCGLNQACYEDTRGYTSNTVLELWFCPKLGNTPNIPISSNFKVEIWEFGQHSQTQIGTGTVGPSGVLGHWFAIHFATVDWLLLPNMCSCAPEKWHDERQERLPHALYTMGLTNLPTSTCCAFAVSTCCLNARHVQTDGHRSFHDESNDGKHGKLGRLYSPWCLWCVIF